MFVKIVYVPNPKYILRFFNLFYLIINQYTFLLCGRIFILSTVFVKKKKHILGLKEDRGEGGEGGANWLRAEEGEGC